MRYWDVLSQSARCEHLCDEVYRVCLLVKPRIIKSHDVFVLELLQHANLCKQTVPATNKVEMSGTS